MTTRWEYSKSLSNYHFDTTINEDADPHYKIIGRIDGDLAAVYEQQLSIYTPKANSFVTRFKVQLHFSNCQNRKLYFLKILRFRRQSNRRHFRFKSKSITKNT